MEKIERSELPLFAKRVLGLLSTTKNRATVLALSGELGAGKTTFVQALAKELGVAGVIQSPTYVLMKSYPVLYGPFTSLVHIDAYRLERPEEFAALKPEQFLNNPGTLVVVEWPEKIVGTLPAPDVAVEFSAAGAAENERMVEVRSGGH